MKKCYTLTFLCALASLAFSQNRYWVGPSSGAGSNWNNTTNWSATSGGAGGASVPNSTGFNVIFDKQAVVNIDLASILLNSIKVTNNKTGILFTSAGTTISVNSSAAGNEGLVIDAGSILVDSASANQDFEFNFAPGSRGEINGDWQFGGASGSGGSPFFTADQAGSVVNVNNNARIIFRYNGGGVGTPSTCFFQNGSFILFEQDGGVTPTAFFAPNSTIRVTGNVNYATTLSGNPAAIGNLEYNCPGLVTDVSMGMIDATIIKGYFKILNTNNHELRLQSNNAIGTPIPPATATITGNVEISGNSRVAISYDERPYFLQVNGNFIQSAGTFSLQSWNTTTGLSSLRLKGNFMQTGGTFTANSTATNNSSSLFVLELNGTGVQHLSASSGNIDNAGNQVALKLNNPAGIILDLPLAAGRIQFVSGKLTTSNTNLLTVNNRGNNAVDVSGASNTSYVEGPVKRKTGLATAYRFPVGKGGVYHFCEIIPATTAASEYIVEYYNTGYPDLSVLLPLSGVANNEYWMISRVSGAAAAIRLFLNGTAVPNASSTDAIVVARYNGTDWVNEKGATGSRITPGNSTSGSATSQSISSFSPITFGYGPSSSLPIKLRYFNAEKGNGSNILHWQVDCYSEQAVFEIERAYYVLQLE